MQEGLFSNKSATLPKNQFDLEPRDIALFGLQFTEDEQKPRDIALFGLQFTEDEQIGNWISRTNGRYKAKEIPKTSHGIMDINKEKVQFNFLKYLEISNINMEVEQLHPCTHEFW